MDKKRIFIGIDISDEARRLAVAYIDDLRSKFPEVRVGWERPEKLHLTLKFVGGFENARLPELTSAVEEIAARHNSFDLSIAGTGVFPSPRKPRVMWLGVIDETSSLPRIQSEIESSVEKLGIAKEEREFNPHLTIARIREPDSAASLAREHLNTTFAPVTFTVSEIVIFESKTLPTGSIYSVVSSARLPGRRATTLPTNHL